MPSAGVTVPSVFAREYGFTVTGTNTLAYAERFANALDVALNAGTLGYTNLSNPADSVPSYTSAADPSVREQEISNGGRYVLDSTTSGIYTFISSGQATTVVGSGIGDDVLVEGQTQVAAQGLSKPSSAIYIDTGGANLITFVDGNNVYDGTAASGIDTIVAGSGDDTINTGSDVKAIAFSGTGSGTFNLNDTIAAGADSNPKTNDPGDYNQFVFLDDGTNLVSANGMADEIIATAPGQLIYGGVDAADTDLVSLVATRVVAPANIQDLAAGSTAIGNDTIVADAATFSVYNATDGNLIYSGSGALVAAFAESVAGSVVGGTGTTHVYGSAGDTIDYFSTDTMTGGIAILGSGAESVDASGAASILTVVLGTGNETLTSGTNTTYNANVDATGNGTSITISDFVPTDTFNFVGYSEAQYEAALQSGTTVSGGYKITLSDSTTVTFTNISSLAGHTTLSPSSSS